MHKQIFVNLPVADLPRSKAFFEGLGLRFEPKFSNDQGACLVVGDSAPRPPQDHGFMYGHGFEDLDGHIWELVYMDPNAPAPH